jgi:hypothetical protein
VAGVLHEGVRGVEAHELAVEQGGAERGGVVALDPGAGVDGSEDAYKQWALYDCRHLDALDVEVFGEVVAERQAWLAVSVWRGDAAGYLGWHRREFDTVDEARRNSPGLLIEVPHPVAGSE